MQRCKTIFVALDKPHGFIYNGKSYHIWASTQENLSSGVREQQRLSLISAFVIRFLEKTEYTIFFLQQPGLHIESGQNVNRPVTTGGNIGDDAALLCFIDANITSFDNM